MICACEELLPNRVDWWHLSSLAGAFFVIGRVIDMEKDNNYNIIIGELRFAWDENKNTCHCYRCNDEIIRLISARKATLRESKQYHSFL